MNCSQDNLYMEQGRGIVEQEREKSIKVGKIKKNPKNGHGSKQGCFGEFCAVFQYSKEQNNGISTHFSHE